MANTLTTQDVYTIMNEVVAQSTDLHGLTVIDSTTFQTVGERVLRTGTESALNALSTVLAKTIFSVRPYKNKFASLTVSPERWGGQLRKIVTLYDAAEASQDHNTAQNPNALAENGSVDMYRIRKPKVMQLNFYGTKVLQKHITRFRDQLSVAFTNESEFVRFIDAIMTEFFNEVELINEGKARLTVCNHIAGMVAQKDKNKAVVDLVAEYNTKFGTDYTRDQLLSTYVDSFMKFIAAQVKIYSKRLTDMSTKYHISTFADTEGTIIRHTPKEKQKMFMYDPLFIEAESQVYSSLFNPQYLEIGNFEGVNFWQSQEQPTKIDIKPVVLDENGNSVDGEQTTIPYVLGILFDEEAMGVLPQFDYTSTTPFNSAGGYYNMFMHWRFNSYSDYTENAVVFVLGDRP